jgi:hypothetical protein
MSSDAYLEDMANAIVKQIKQTRELVKDLKPTPTEIEMMKRSEKDWQDIKKLSQMVREKLKAEGLL